MICTIRAARLASHVIPDYSASAPARARSNNGSITLETFAPLFDIIATEELLESLEANLTGPVGVGDLPFFQARVRSADGLRLEQAFGGSSCRAR
jgi:hypothetical protein